MQRVVPLEGCFNFRDLGGYPTEDGRSVRWRQVFRSDALHLLTPNDVVRLRDELRIATIIDLRSTSELQTEGQGSLAAEAVELHHVPLYDGQRASTESWPPLTTLADRYFFLAEFAKAPIAQVITAIADAKGPAVYHCAAGKDRTGVVSAVLLSLLGVREEVIVADYTATRENLDAIIERLLASEGYQAILAALPPETMHAEPGTMITFLERVRARYGSMRGYARAIGVSEAAIDRLTSRLITPPTIKNP